MGTGRLLVFVLLCVPCFQTGLAGANFPLPMAIWRGTEGQCEERGIKSTILASLIKVIGARNGSGRTCLGNPRRIIGRVDDLAHIRVKATLIGCLMREFCTEQCPVDAVTLGLCQ